MLLESIITASNTAIDEIIVLFVCVFIFCTYQAQQSVLYFQAMILLCCDEDLSNAVIVN